MAGNDVFLYSVPSDADSDDVRLRDPTQVAGGGSTEALSGEATLALTSTGVLTSVTSLSGGATLALTTTGALTSTSALSGTATLALATTGALLSTTALSGAGSLTLTASGALVSTTAFSGAASLILTATGNITGTTSFSGAATLALATTGTLAATTAFSGEATLALTATGDLSGTDGAVIEALSGEATLALQATGDLSVSGAQTPKGDDVAGGHGDVTRSNKGVRPIVKIRPKVERDLDDVLELIETVSETRRVSDNKKTIKAAVVAIKAIEAPQNYKPAIASIQKALVKVSRNTAKHEGLQAAMVQISLDLEKLIADMEYKRKRRRREEDEIAIWLSFTHSI